MVRALLPGTIRYSATDQELASALADSLYAGYIESQQAVFSRIHQHDDTPIPASLDFRDLSGLSREMVDRLERARPLSFGQARKVPGLTPAALATLLVHLKGHRKAA
jgi:tRNA uridine 5-carboxymethylaminomethyl modification enzyme